MQPLPSWWSETLYPYILKFLRISPCWIGSCIWCEVDILLVTANLRALTNENLFPQSSCGKLSERSLRGLCFFWRPSGIIHSVLSSFWRCFSVDCITAGNTEVVPCFCPSEFLLHVPLHLGPALACQSKNSVVHKLSFIYICKNLFDYDIFQMETPTTGDPILSTKWVLSFLSNVE